MPDSSSPLQALQQATKVVGGQAALGRLCGVVQPSVWGWLNRIGRLPAEHVLKVEAATGISRHDLRPDIYPRDAVPPTVPGSGIAGSGAGRESPLSSRADSPVPDSLSGLTP
jgi:DNA-binding transcriptional regulator YdaS (Cro superfamily)